MNYESPSTLPFLGINICTGLIAAITLKDAIGFAAAFSALISSIFAIRHYYYSAKLSKKNLKALDNK